VFGEGKHALFTRTIADRPGIRTVSQPLHNVLFTVGSLMIQTSGNTQMPNRKLTHIFTVAFCPINRIARTYPCPISPARMIRPLRYSRSRFLLAAFDRGAVDDGSASPIAGPESLDDEGPAPVSVESPLLCEIDSRYTEAWYRKLSL